jgi:hypothetical protein
MDTHPSQSKQEVTASVVSSIARRLRRTPSGVPQGVETAGRFDYGVADLFGRFVFRLWIWVDFFWSRAEGSVRGTTYPSNRQVPGFRPAPKAGLTETAENSQVAEHRRASL